MTVLNRILNYLDSHKVHYELMEHKQAYASSEVARALHVPGGMFAKSVVVESEGRWIMAVLPASYRVDLSQLKEAIGSRMLHLVTEAELTKACPDCEVGAFPPFGNLYGMEVWVERSLAESDEIVFNAGTHKEALRIKYADFASLVKPILADFCEARAA